MSAELKLPNDQSPQQQRNSPCLDNTLSQASLEDEKDSRIYPSLHLQNIMNRNLYLRVEIEDHGIGLSEDVMSTLFSPFKQAQRLAGGTGLGLFSLAKRLEALEGGCGVQRRRDGEEGSLFWFEIPYRPDYTIKVVGSLESIGDMGSPLFRSASDQSLFSEYFESSKCSSAKVDVHTFFGAESLELEHPLATYNPLSGVSVDSTPSVKLDPATPPSSLHVLVVDDSPAILKMTSLMLRRHNHTISTATNGAEAVQTVSEHWEDDSGYGGYYDVILMDLQMPVMDGLEATRRLRKMEERYTSKGKKLLIIGMSANSDNETANTALKVGVDAFMAKPFSLETFYKTYRSLVET
eukprot:scaffold2678_cov236-Ochromonas_danica.AAC.5